MAAEARFRAMGSDARVIVVGGRERRLLGRARDLIDDLERTWSRFLPRSEVSRFNACAPGVHAFVSDPTLQLLSCAKRAWELTAGTYDPTVLPAVRGAGYDADFDIVRARGDDGREVQGEPAPGCAGLVIDPVARTVTKTNTLEIDPGGIGKALAADLVSATVLEHGAAGVLVNLGGDLRVRGDCPDGRAWSIRVAHPSSSGDMLRMALDDGAVATSTTLRRRWMRGGTLQHHVIDPRTGVPVASAFVGVTALANEGWWAEAATKAVLVSSTSAADLPGVHVATVDQHGHVACTPGLAIVAA